VLHRVDVAASGLGKQKQKSRFTTLGKKGPIAKNLFWEKKEGGLPTNPKVSRISIRGFGLEQKKARPTMGTGTRATRETEIRPG